MCEQANDDKEQYICEVKLDGSENDKVEVVKIHKNELSSSLLINIKIVSAID